jgi:hypothetical protein
MEDQKQNVVVGDRIYCHHPKRGLESAEVASVGKHGVTVKDGKDFVGVRWGAILGHHTRKERKLKVVEHGEDGFIAEDESGKRVFVRDGEHAEPMRKALLLDVGGLSCGCTDHALEVLHKAMSEDGINDWARHESPFIAALIERFTTSGVLKSEKVREELSAWIEGKRHVSGRARHVPSNLAGKVWGEAELGLVKTYLESLPSLALDDWSLLIDYLAQRYMPIHELLNEAEMLTAKAAMMGKVEAHFAKLPEAEAERVLDALPTTVADVKVTFSLSNAAVDILDYGKLKACEEVTSVSEGLRHGIKQTVLSHQHRKLSGDVTATPAELQQQLFDRFARFNKDWRIIAVTEAGEMCNQGVIAAQPPESMVRRLEQYHGACPFCRKLDGRVFRVTTPDDPKKDGAKDVWVGKTNVGRSSAPRKRVGDELIERTQAERWWPAAGTQHPHCRGRWEPMAPLKPGDDPEFARWMMERAGVKFGMDY